MRTISDMRGSRARLFAPLRLAFALTVGWAATARAEHCIDYRQFIPELGRVPLAAAAVGVAQAGDYAYIAQGAAGLQVVDVSDPCAPAVVATIGTLGNVLDVEAQGTLLYVANGVALQILDLTTPASPSLLGSVPIAGAAKITLDGTRVYVAAGATGLVIVDASQSSSPTILGTFDHPRDILNVVLEGTTAYVILYSNVAPGNQLGIVDVTNPAAPTLLAQSTFPPIQSLYPELLVQGDRLFVTWASDIYEIDVTIPTSLVIVDDLNLPGPAWGGRTALDREGARVYGLSHEVFSVSEPTSSGFATHVMVDLPTPFEAVPTLEVKGGRAYLCTGAELRIFDVSGPLGPTNFGFIDTPGSATDLCVDGVLAFVADGAAGGLQVLDVENPEAPVVLGSIDTPGSATRVAAVNRTACVADGNAVQIIDASVPTAPVLASTLSFTNVRDVAMRGNLLLVADNAGLHTVDVSNPSTPAPLGFLSTSVFLQVEISGDYAYGLCGGCPLSVVDLRDPVNPSLLTFINVGTSFYMAIAADRLFAVGGSHTEYMVHDISNPAQPTFLLSGRFVLGGMTGYIAADASSAYFVDFNSRWMRIFDAAPPSLDKRAFAALVQGLPDLGGSVRADGGWLYLTAGSRGVFVFPTHCESPTSVLDPEAQSMRSSRLEIWPNPAHTEAQVAFVAPAAGAVRLEVFDVSGRRVRDAFAGTVGAGRHVVRWDCRDAAGAPVGSGVYLVRLSGASGVVATRRMAVIR